MQDNALNSPLFFLGFCSRFYTFNDVAITGGPTSNYFDLVRAKQIAFSHFGILEIVNIRRATRGGAFGHLTPPKFSKHCIAILSFVETFKEQR